MQLSSFSARQSVLLYIIPFGQIQHVGQNGGERGVTLIPAPLSAITSKSAWSWTGAPYGPSTDIPRSISPSWTRSSTIYSSEESSYKPLYADRDLPGFMVPWVCEALVFQSPAFLIRISMNDLAGLDEIVNGCHSNFEILEHFTKVLARDEFKFFRLWELWSESISSWQVGVHEFCRLYCSLVRPNFKKIDYNRHWDPEPCVASFPFLITPRYIRQRVKD